MTNSEIGNRIKYARDLRNATLEDIAKKVGVTKSTIQRYEAGKITTIKLPVVEAIAVALNVNPAWVVGKSDIIELPAQKTLKIIEYYELLNNTGKCEATKRVKELTELSQYTNSLNFNEELAGEFTPDDESNIKYVIKNKFNNIEDAKGYLYSQQLLAGLDSGNVTESDLIKIANKIYSNNTQERRL